MSGSEDLSVGEVIAFQRRSCESAGSHLYAAILDGIGADHAAGGVCASLLDPWSERAMADAIPLRLLAGVHRLVLEGRAPDLARFYPSADGFAGTSAGGPGAEHDRDSAVAAFLTTCRDEQGTLAEAMARNVQTNEVGRACALVGAFHRIARSTGLPLRLLEVGASAGLLLRWDRYGYRSGAWSLGPQDGLVFDDPFVEGPPPRAGSVTVASRVGCDVAPIDPTTDEGATTLRSFLWPDQVHRRARLDAAIEVARRVPVTVERADAGEWIEERLAEPVPGVATVVHHSIVLQYLPRPSFRRLRAAIHGAGERATAEAPVHWLRFEPAGPVADVRLRSWPGDEDVVLATSGYHGPPVNWLAPPTIVRTGG